MIAAFRLSSFAHALLGVARAAADRIPRDLLDPP
jgi:hypothetical protein